ncbi:MAG: acyl-CoA dehydrogenase family protein, partial [Ilumatobacteraceae bacterium]
MDPRYSSEAESFRSRVVDFLTRSLPADFPGIGGMPADEVRPWVMEWRKVLHAERYLAPGWPAEYGGGGLSALEQVILAEEFAKAGVPTCGPNDGFGITMLGNT